MTEPPRTPTALDRRRFLATTGTVTAGLLASPPMSFGEAPSGSEVAAHVAGAEATAPTVEDCFALHKAGKRIPVIFDTDIGDDIDDTWALLYLLKCPELDVRLISCEEGHSRDRAKIVAKMLEAVGRTDIPIAMGPQPNGTCRQSDWVADYSLDAYPGTILDDAAGAIIKTVNESAEPMTVMGIGPVPVIADAVRRDPFLTRKARFVGMHGSINVGYNGSDTPVPEYNVKRSPEALRTVLEGDWEPTLTPLDTCGLLKLTDEKYQAVRTSRAAGVPELMANYDLWLPNAKWVGDISSDEVSTVLFDIVAVTLGFTESWFQMETLPLEIDDAGMTLVNRTDGRPTRLALRWRDLEGYEDHVVNRLTGPIAPAAS